MGKLTLVCCTGCAITLESTACTTFAPLIDVTLGFDVTNLGGKLVGILNKLASVLVSRTAEFCDDATAMLPLLIG